MSIQPTPSPTTDEPTTSSPVTDEPTTYQPTLGGTTTVATEAEGAPTNPPRPN